MAGNLKVRQSIQFPYLSWKTAASDSNEDCPIFTLVDITSGSVNSLISLCISDRAGLCFNHWTLLDYIVFCFLFLFFGDLPGFSKE